ncbi:MAG: four helix bundle protein [Candidatus Cloacimonetes bacterium]|nr:four helix bundle protein [Candidatus Cloacimonadota bacterium]
MKKFAIELEKRTKDFSINLIKTISKIGNTPELKIIRYQVVKSGTSIGANYREANRAISKAEFKAKISICEKEASETVYWLEILKSILGNENIKKDINKLRNEANELLAIFISSGKSLSKDR